jgi:single-stranded-DNA-specific exonuclease
VRCDAIAQLDFNKHLYDRDRDYAPSHRGYEIRLVAVRLAEAAGVERLGVRENAIADWRGTRDRLEEVASSYFVLQDCPLSWNELYRGVETAIAQSRSLALAYPPPLHLNPKQLWLQLLGIAKYLSRTGERATRARVAAKLGLSRPTVEAGLAALSALGFEVECDRDEFRLRWNADAVVVDETAISAFLACVEEEQFKRQYFYRVPLATVQAMVGNRDIVSEYG